MTVARNAKLRSSHLVRSLASCVCIACSFIARPLTLSIHLGMGGGGWTEQAQQQPSQFHLPASQERWRGLRPPFLAHVRWCEHGAPVRGSGLCSVLTHL